MRDRKRTHICAKKVYYSHPSLAHVTKTHLSASQCRSWCVCVHNSIDCSRSSSMLNKVHETRLECSVQRSNLVRRGNWTRRSFLLTRNISCLPSVLSSSSCCTWICEPGAGQTRVSLKTAPQGLLHHACCATSHRAVSLPLLVEELESLTECAELPCSFVANSRKYPRTASVHSG